MSALESRDRQCEEVLIAGAGPIGIAVAVSAMRRGIDPLLIDAGAICNSILHYPIGMSFFTTPELLEIGGHPFPCAGAKPTREEALKYYRGVVRSEGLRVDTYTRLCGAANVAEGITCLVETRRGREERRCRTLILATGYYDHPNLLGVPGEDLPHVTHYFDEAHRCYGLRVVVIGGRNSAVEACLELHRAGAAVTLVSRAHAFAPSVKYWLRPDIENRIRDGAIEAILGAQVEEIGDSWLRIAGSDGRRHMVAADRVYALTGFHPDHALFRGIGIELVGEELRPRVDPETLETNVPGVHMAGSITAGRRTSEIFIENGRFDGEKIFSALPGVG
ncbi:MAG: YpdA family putative bacillithiol disulfide reductase [Planctomycetota bacterium]